MGNSQSNPYKSSSHQGDLSKLISNYLQEQNNTFHNMSQYNKPITKSHLSRVLNSKSVISNARLLSYKLFTQANITTLNTNIYQSSLASAAFLSDKSDISTQLDKTNDVLLKKHTLIYQKKHSIEVSSAVSYHPTEDIHAKKSKVVKNRNSHQQHSFSIEEHNQLNIEGGTGGVKGIASIREIESQLNQTEILHSSNNNHSHTHYNYNQRGNDDRTFDDMNLQEYLNEETKSIRHNQSLRDSSNHTQIKTKRNIKDISSNTINFHDHPSTFTLNQVSSLSSLKTIKGTIRKKHHKNNLKKPVLIHTQFNTINYNTLYDNEGYYNNTDQNDHEIPINVPMRKYKSPNNSTSKNINLLNNKHINNTQQKPTSYQSFREHLSPKAGKGNNMPVPLLASQKNKVSHKSGNLSKHNSISINRNNDSCMGVKELEKGVKFNTLSNMNYHRNGKGSREKDKEEIGNDRHNHSHMNLNYTPKSTRVVSMKASFSSKKNKGDRNDRVTENSKGKSYSKGNGYGNGNGYKNGNGDQSNIPKFNIKIDLRDLMKNDNDGDEHHREGYHHVQTENYNYTIEDDHKEIENQHNEPEPSVHNDNNDNDNHNDNEGNNNIIGDFYVDIERDLNDNADHNQNTNVNTNTNDNGNSFRMNTQPRNPPISNNNPNNNHPLNFTILKNPPATIPRKDRYSTDRSSLDRLIITQQKVDQNGKIIT